MNFFKRLFKKERQPSTQPVPSVDFNVIIDSDMELSEEQKDLIIGLQKLASHCSFPSNQPDILFDLL